MGPDTKANGTKEVELGELFAILARDCGWDKDFIGDNLTFDQVKRYVEVLDQRRAQDHKTQTYCFFVACATAFGGIKQKEFQEFISQFDSKKPKIDETLNRMKEMDLPIEEN